MIFLMEFAYTDSSKPYFHRDPPSSFQTDPLLTWAIYSVGHFAEVQHTG